MQLQFEADLAHQAAAIDAVVQAIDGASLRQGGIRSDDGIVAVANPEGLPEALAVEMETGTGKTYTYLRTALELSERYGVRKFVVVVPSVAIREGVLSTLQATRTHFRGLFPMQDHRFFVYERQRLGRLRKFVRGTSVDFMVVTVDAFTKDSNVLRRGCDVFGGRAPLRALAATRPVVILDEPHRMQTALRRRALAELAPASTLAYGATLGRWQGRVAHRLTAAQAHARGLVKSITVHGASRVDGYAEQIRATVACHLERDRALRDRGIKVLSLFFLDTVAAYADADGLARRLFDEAFDTLKVDHPAFAALPASAVRSAYFAVRSGRAVDTKTGQAASDAEAYALILRDKPRLLSFDEPVSFVFSHSALREGWDNPNVFQICTLGRSDSSIRKRQEIGRGVRLCVDRHGRRVTDPEVNVLDVFANESYEAFVRSLQADEGQGDAHVWTRRTRASVRPDAPQRDWLLGDVDVTIRAAAAQLCTFEAMPSRGGHVIDEALATLTRWGLPVRRATVSAILDSSGRGDALVSDPVRGGAAIAASLRRALEATINRSMRDVE